jgi:hypothetical protein
MRKDHGQESRKPDARLREDRCRPRSRRDGWKAARVRRALSLRCAALTAGGPFSKGKLLGMMKAALANQVLNSMNQEVLSMCEVLVRRIITPDLPYDLEEPSDGREITRGLMRLSQQALSKYVDKEPNLY